MNMYLIASSIKIINKHNALLFTDSSQPRWFMLRLVYMFLGCDLSIQLLLKSFSSVHNRLHNRLVDRFYHVQNFIVNKCMTTSIIKHLDDI